MKKKKFKAMENDAEGNNYWVVWDSKCEYRYAEFYGKYCREFARAHAKLLNGLEREKQP